MSYTTKIRYNRYVRHFCRVTILNERNQVTLEKTWIPESDVPTVSAQLLRLTNFIRCDSHKKVA